METTTPTPLDAILQQLRGTDAAVVLSPLVQGGVGGGFPAAGKSLWQTITGFDANTESSLAPDKRRQSLRKLLHAVKQLIGAEIQLDEVLPPEEKEERTIFWNPLPSICHHLGIARSKLTSFMKELTGVAAHELIDQQRVKDLKTQLRDEIRLYAREWREKFDDGSFQRKHLHHLEEMLAEKVKNERLKKGICDPTTLALSYKVPTYARYYRACLVVHKKTPLQLEAQIIADVLDEILAAEATRPPDVQKNLEEERQVEKECASCPSRADYLRKQHLECLEYRAENHKKWLEQIVQRLQSRRS
jgi:hypothetical protein